MQANLLVTGQRIPGCRASIPRLSGPNAGWRWQRETTGSRTLTESVPVENVAET